PETRLVEYQFGDLRLLLAVISLLIVDRRDVADRFEQAMVVKPPDPLQGSELDILMAPPWTLAMNHLRLEEADDCLGQSIVVRVAAAADRRLDAGLRET